MMKKTLLPLVALLALSVSASDFGQEGNYTVTKISNPMCGEGEIDGLIPGGFRENSYTWRLAMRGDEIYIATARNLANGVVNLFAPALGGIPEEALWSMVDLATNGAVPHNSLTDEGANIISYNRKTGEFKTIYTAEKSIYFRMAVTFGDDVYFGTYTADPTKPQYILKLDTDGNFTKVFETSGSVSLRANCVYDNHLFFAGADAREVVAPGDENPTKIAILRKSNNDDTNWERVADYKDFGALAFDGIMGNSSGCPVWELATHNGYIYASGPSTEGMWIYKGHPAASGEQANEYGWYWEEVAGLNNGINNPGLSDVVGGEPNTLRSLIGSVFEFKGELYAYNFDHTIGSMQYAFLGVAAQALGQDVKPSSYLAPMYSTITNPQKVWKLNDETGKFEECVGFTELVTGTTVEYVWRMGVYDDQLYISTMDSGVCYDFLTQLTDGSFFTMTPEERERKIGYLENVINLLSESEEYGEIADQLVERLEQLKEFLTQFDENELPDEAIADLLERYKQMLDGLLEAIVQYLDGGLDNDARIITSALLSDNNKAAAFVNKLAMLSNKSEDYVQNTLIPKRVTPMALEDDIATLLETVYAYLMENLDQILGQIDAEGARMYLYINKLVMEDEWGFDLFRTSDGVDFEVVTRDGFGDRYNYGCPSFLATEEGLYIGTCNPFYGGQLHLLTNNKPFSAVHDVKVNNHTESNIYYTPSGIRINGRPTEPGIYIHDGQKVFINK